MICWFTHFLDSLTTELSCNHQGSLNRSSKIGMITEGFKLLFFSFFFLFFGEREREREREREGGGEIKL